MNIPGSSAATPAAGILSGLARKLHQSSQLTTPDEGSMHSTAGHASSGTTFAGARDRQLSLFTALLWAQTPE
jgi:hypothetical protein